MIHKKKATKMLTITSSNFMLTGIRGTKLGTNSQALIIKSCMVVIDVWILNF